MKEGNLVGAKLLVSEDNLSFKSVANLNWQQNAKYKTIKFDKLKVRYLKLEILEAIDDRAIIAEVEVGRTE